MEPQDTRRESVRRRRRAGHFSCWGGVLLASVATTSLAYAQNGPEISISVTGRHERLEGMPTQNTVLVQVGVAPPTSGTISSDPGPPEYVPIQVESELEAPGSSDIPLDPLERDDAASLEGLSKRTRRYRGSQTQSQDGTMAGPWLLTPKFVDAAIKSALASQGITSTLGRLEGLATRAKTSALLPEVRFRAGRNADQSLRLAPTADDPYRYSQSGGVAYVLEGAATFRLNRLVFANEELGIERLRLAQARERERMTSAVVDELLAWQDAYRELSQGGASAGRGQVRLSQSALRLDVLTGGWFSEHTPRGPKPESAPVSAASPHASALPPRPVEPGGESLPPTQAVPARLMQPEAHPSPGSSRPPAGEGNTPKGRPKTWAGATRKMHCAEAPCA